MCPCCRRREPYGRYNGTKIRCCRPKLKIYEILSLIDPSRLSFTLGWRKIDLSLIFHFSNGTIQAYFLSAVHLFLSIALAPCLLIPLLGWVVRAFNLATTELGTVHNTVLLLSFKIQIDHAVYFIHHRYSLLYSSLPVFIHAVFTHLTPSKKYTNKIFLTGFVFPILNQSCPTCYKSTFSNL